MTKHSILIVTLLTTAVLIGGCKSELDNKPTATVEEPDKAEAKKEAPEAEARKEAAKPEATKKEAIKKEAAKPAAAGLTLDAAASKISFVGAKITGDHTGTFKKFTGTATVADGAVTGASFSVDMGTVEADHPKLTAHLLSPDFFNAAKYPAATFKSTGIKAGGEGGTHTVTGELTLLSTTKKITFPATIAVTDSGATGKAEFKINRKDFGIVYPGKPDDLIKDDVLLKLDLAFKKG